MFKGSTSERPSVRGVAMALALSQSRMTQLMGVEGSER